VETSSYECISKRRIFLLFSSSQDAIGWEEIAMDFQEFPNGDPLA
jgi:hypothetical protein